MGMQVIAEGVETQKEFYTCKDIGADFIQGFLVQKPTKNINEILPIYNDISNLREVKQKLNLYIPINSRIFL